MQRQIRPAPETEPPAPYDPEILRLAEIPRALTYLDDLCASNPSGDWRAKMQALLEADAKTAARKERLAGSYNRGFPTTMKGPIILARKTHNW